MLPLYSSYGEFDIFVSDSQFPKYLANLPWIERRRKAGVCCSTGTENVLKCNDEWEQGWRSGESALLSPVWRGFDSGSGPYVG